jgi:hypothetical protein
LPIFIGHRRQINATFVENRKFPVQQQQQVTVAIALRQHDGTGLCVTLFHDSNERRNFVGLQIWNDLANNLDNFCVFHLEASCNLSFAGPESDPFKPDTLK